MPTVQDATTVGRYVSQHGDIAAILANLSEFVESMPCPNGEGHIPNVDYGYMGSVAHIHELLSEVSRVVDSMCAPTECEPAGL